MTLFLLALLFFSHYKAVHAADVEKSISNLSIKESAKSFDDVQRELEVRAGLLIRWY